ncbi:MAG: glycosyltransferase family 2 protein [Bifidobacteriaceae bacterium]|nr:glycosyltransferase family 2 protein [Bifidobacteriaceae bacterium]
MGAESGRSAAREGNDRNDTPDGSADSLPAAGPSLAEDLDDVWVVVPAYNEAAAIGPVLEGLTAVFAHVAVVDDASSDGTGDIAAAYPTVRLVRHPINLGQGAALQTGFDYVLRDPAARRVVTFDADGQHRAADALAMVRRLGTPSDLGAPLQVILGTRFGPGATAGAGRARLGVLRLAVAYTRATVRLPVTDTHNGLRAMTREVVAQLRLRQGGMAHATEILERVRASGFAWAEHPVTIDYSAYSQAKGQSMLNAINILTDLAIGRSR